MSEQDHPGQDAVELAHQLFDLARQGATEQLEAYLGAGAPVDLTDPKGNTLLMLAAYHGHAGLVAAQRPRSVAPGGSRLQG